MGAASSQSQQLKLFSSSVDKHKGSDKKFELDNGVELEKQKTEPRILVSINKDNTVRISEGKSIATQTPREGHTLSKDEEKVETKKEQNVKENNECEIVEKEKIDRAVQTDGIIHDNNEKGETTNGDSKVIIPPLEFDGKETRKFVESPDLNQEKESTYRSVNISESETDDWTDIGVQTDDDFETGLFGPTIAWGSKSVDSAITLNQNSKEETNQEEKEKDTHSDLEAPTPTPAKPFEQQVLERYGKYKVRLASDKEKCIISSATFLETGDAVVVDRSNQKMKFVDKKFQFISSHDLSAKPWAVCAKGVDVYVTMGNTKVQHLTVEDMIIEPVDIYEIKGRCLGICVYGEHIAVGLQVGEICLLDFKGKTQGTIQLPTANGRSCNPWHLTVTAEDNILVTDSDAGAIYCVNRKSEQIFTFKGFGSPRGTAIDTEGNILIVGRDKETGTVVTFLHRDVELQHLLHIEQQSDMKSRVLMTWEKLEFVPYCICYRSDRVVVLGGLQESLKIMKIG